MYTTVNFPGCSLPMHIYLQIKTWMHEAQARQRWKESVMIRRMLMDFPWRRCPNPRGKALRGCIEVKESSCGFPVTSSFVGPSCVFHHPTAPPSQGASVVLPQLHPPQIMKSGR
ncbi:Protein ANKUB1 [Labeo rohita]|uniref:Protein ANKUB1 n=1 Tax=Labeo rohita TaxID=84645 RepID=A0ABQ8LHD8_LABRO|nr:Protein ANKUB1 [Labeo rohita]